MSSNNASASSASHLRLVSGEQQQHTEVIRTERQRQHEQRQYEQRRRYVYEPVKQTDLGPETVPVARTFNRACLRCDKKFETDARFERMCSQCRGYIGSVSPQWVGF